ncbi:GNAT family N-acetyltransferase [Kribbella sp. NBC_00482]|uniref:GNAT family N-acetyltransferase n=1 Tax=Kribbella sp. NBC_00482 TaxID=2975968 RepID=UPI002E178770
MIATASIDALMNQGWPAADSTELDGWLVRRSAGVTMRANSVLPASAPFDLDRALEYVESLYASHQIAPSFQVGPAAEPGGLDEYLAARGYELRTPTLVMCAEIADVLAKLPEPTSAVNISSAPDDAWMDLWWAVDGHGGSAAQPVARQILNRGRALYATISSGGQPQAVGRLALVDDWAGIYCLAVDPAHRRQGLAQATIHGLLQKATTLGVDRVWLQVVEANAPARVLYDRLGFQAVSRYHYRVKG